MRVTEATGERMVIEDRPLNLRFIAILATAGPLAGALAAALAGAPLVALGLVVLAASTAGGVGALLTRRRISLDRRAGRVTLTTERLFGRTQDEVALARVDGTVVETRQIGPGVERFRPALRLAGGGTLPLTPVYVHGDGAGEVARQIDAWLKSGPG